ncbi:MAG TPA: futalosine hydrolase [Nitrospiraceae bacterium]|nr:futalosine hydrolase [Nitrospiraceae bacterium]
MIALLCSVPVEYELLRSALPGLRSLVLGSKPVFLGSLGGRDVALCAGGLGKANAAHAATLLLSRFNPAALIVFGIGGAYPSSGARIGDIALATEEIAGDDGVLTPEGFRDTEHIGIPLVRTGQVTLHNRFPASEMPLAGFYDSLSASGINARLIRGPFITLSTCTGTTQRTQELERQFGNPLCENMEGAAAAQVAELHGVPWIEVRGISNIVEDRDLTTWEIPRAAAAAQVAVELIVKHVKFVR